MFETRSTAEEPTPDLNTELLEFERQLAEDPNNPKLCWNVALTLGAIYAKALIAEIKGAKSDLDLDDFGQRAILAARRVIEICPENSYSYTNLASFLMLRLHYLNILEWSRLNPEEQVAKAPEIFLMSISDEMFDLYIKALEVDPKDCHYFGLIVPYCLTQGNFERAAELIDQGVSVGGIGSYEARLFTARIEREKGNYDLAIDRFRELFDPTPEYSDFMCDLIETYRLAGRFEEMLDLTESTLKRCPNLANAHCSLAKYYESQGKSEEAAKAHATYCTLVNGNLKSLWLNEG